MSDAVLVLGRWRVGAPEQQADAIDAAVAAWNTVGWPPGLESYTAIAAEDGTRVLHLSHWRNDRAARGFTATAKNQWAAAVDEVAPGVQRLGVEVYRVYDGVQVADTTTGCLVLVDIDSDDSASAHRWMDAMLALGRRRESAPGMLSATFYLSVSGSRVLNVAEWSDTASHQAMTTASRSAAADDLISGSAGARPVGFTRSRSWRTITDSMPESARA
ncbi:hypothetical protein [Pseudonocardia phyllosphaerae]|uniref:hypothetical protein n=1 Tax=Pseudonocardia phyllosphaerae TaxID=3390502 RepID=UPI003979038D